MADGYKNTVPLGQVGTGSAYVLGPNMALQRWMGDIDQQKNMKMQADQHNASINRANYSAFNQRLSQIKPSSGMYRDDVNELISEHVNEGARLMSEGINPYAPDYNNQDAVKASQEFIQREQNIQVTQSLVQDYAKAKDEAIKEYNKNPTSFDVDEYLNILNFEKNNTITDIIAGRAEVPRLKKAFDVGSFVKNNVGTPKTTNISYASTDGGDFQVTVTEPDFNQLFQNVKYSMSSGEGRNYMNQQLRDAGIDGDASGIIGTTDVEEIRQRLDENYRTPAEGNQVGHLIASGRIPSLDSPEYEQFLDDSVKEQLKAEQVAARVFNQVARTALAQSDSSYKVEPTFDLIKEADRQKAAKQRDGRYAMAVTKHNERKSASPPDELRSKDLEFAYGDGQSTTITDFSGIYIPAKSIVGSTAISRETGLPVEVSNTEKYETSGVGLAYINSRTGALTNANDPDAVRKPMALVTRKYNVGGNSFTEDFLIDVEELPYNQTDQNAAYIDALRKKANKQDDRETINW